MYRLLWNLRDDNFFFFFHVVQIMIINAAMLLSERIIKIAKHTRGSRITNVCNVYTQLGTITSTYL